jgi:hypothetical protein
MRFAICRLVVLALNFGLSTVAWCSDLVGQWDLKIEDKNHNVVTVLVIEFTDYQAKSCIAGNWLQVNVISSTANDAQFFPVSDALSYSVEKNQITIGRNEICDAYLMLQGTLSDKTIQGDYFSLGWSSTPLGFFALTRRK